MFRQTDWKSLDKFSCCQAPLEFVDPLDSKKSKDLTDLIGEFYKDEILDYALELIDEKKWFVVYTGSDLLLNSREGDFLLGQ